MFEREERNWSMDRIDQNTSSRTVSLLFLSFPLSLSLSLSSFLESISLVTTSILSLPHTQVTSCSVPTHSSICIGIHFDSFLSLLVLSFSLSLLVLLSLSLSLSLILYHSFRLSSGILFLSIQYLSLSILCLIKHLDTRKKAHEQTTTRLIWSEVLFSFFLFLSGIVSRFLSLFPWKKFCVYTRCGRREKSDKKAERGRERN